MKIRNLSLILLLSTSSLYAYSLKQSISDALDTNPTVQERLKNYNLVREDKTIAVSGFYPKLDLVLGAGYENTNNVATKLKAATSGTDENLGLTPYQSSIKYTQNIFQGFETVHAINSQEARLGAAAFSYIETANDIALQTTKAYLAVVKNIELLSIAKENVSINEEIFNKVQKLYESGLTTLSESNKIESSLSLARSNYIVQENNLLDAQYTFKRLIGRNVSKDKFVRPTFDSYTPDNVKEATAFAITNNPSILVSNFNVLLAQETYKGAKGKFYPRLDIEISQSLNNNLSGIEGEDSRFRAMAFLSYNLFNGFADSAALQQGVSKIHQENELKNDIRRRIIENIDLSWAGYTKITDQLVHLKNYKKFSLKTLKLYAKEYDLGRRSLLDLLSAQNDFVGAQSQIVNAEYAILDTQYRLLDSMGILVLAIVDDANRIFENVGLDERKPSIANNYMPRVTQDAEPTLEKDTLPIYYDRDNDLIADNLDQCDNSFSGDMKDEFGCSTIFDDVERIERYSEFNFVEQNVTLSRVGKIRIRKLVKQLGLYGYDQFEIIINGSADFSDHNITKEQLVSQERANIIKAQFVEAGMDETKITANGLGARSVLYSKETSDSNDKNNRVDIIVKKFFKE